MKFVGVDLHKHTITVCVMNQVRKVLCSRKLRCEDERELRIFFRALGEFQVVVEATASYEWFVRLVEPFACRVVLAHPRKLRVIAESTSKTDKIDARILAQFLALDMIPAAYRPTPRQREHRRLVRLRQYIQSRMTGLKSKVRRVLSDYNADVPHLFTRAGLAYLRDEVKLSEVDRYLVEQFLAELAFQKKQLRAAEVRLQEFAREGSAQETAQRELLRSIPRFGEKTTDIVLAELAGHERFSSQKKGTAYAGLAPGQRESAGKRQNLSITKEGSALLRWALIQAAWRLVIFTPEWKAAYLPLAARCGKRKAIVAIARKLLCLILAMLKSGQPYRPRAMTARERKGTGN